jgi:hypothetical protein
MFSFNHGSIRPFHALQNAMSSGHQHRGWSDERMGASPDSKEYVGNRLLSCLRSGRGPLSSESRTPWADSGLLIGMRTIGMFLR